MNEHKVRTLMIHDTTKKRTSQAKQVQFKVEKNRVLVPVGEPCPFGCRYCYTRGGEVGPPRPDAQDILARFEQFAHENSFDIIQFGYDSDPFARPERGLMMLQTLTKMNKHVNFSTKALLAGPIISALRDMRQHLEANEKTLSAFVSLSCWDSAASVEPHTPSPAERVQTIANLQRIGIPVFISVRPILPHIADEEYERIVLEGLRAGCEGFILGPLYADARRRFVRFIPSSVLESTPGQTTMVSWSAHAPTWTRYEDTDRLQRLLAMIESRGGRTFVSSTDAIALVQSRESVA